LVALRARARSSWEGPLATTVDSGDGSDGDGDGGDAKLLHMMLAINSTAEDEGRGGIISEKPFQEKHKNVRL
jgi:hypothetical protein